MNCSFCGVQLPQAAAVCPNCGATVSPYTSNSGIHGNAAPYDPTVASASSAPQTPQATYYGTDPYNAPPPPPQQYPSSPYNMPPPAYYPPPTPPAKKRGGRIALIVSIAVLVPILICSTLLFFVLRNSANSVSPTTDVTQNPYPPKTGTLVLNDPMSDNSKGYKWDESTSSPTNTASDTATCGFSGGTYHISETQKGGFLCDPEAQNLLFNDLAFEIKLTILKGDNTGVIIREDQAGVKGYMFFIDTQGNYTLEASDATNSANSNKTLRSGKNAAIKQGLNQMNLIALVANGNTISAYVNNTLIDSVQDNTFSSGQIGLYAAGLNNAYDVTASDARAWRIGNALPTPTATQNPYSPKTGTLVINDPLHDNSKGYGWDEFTNNRSATDIYSCTFTAGVYQVSRTQKGSSFCVAKAQDLVFNNVAFETQVTITKGEGAGVIVRYDPTNYTGYVFFVGIQSDYSLYAFNFKTTDANKQYTLLRNGTNTAIKRGLNQTNLVALVANGNMISVYANNQFIDTIQDSTYTNSGQVGIYVEGSNGEVATASSVRAWRI